MYYKLTIFLCYLSILTLFFFRIFYDFVYYF